MRFNPKSKGRWKWLLIIGVPIVALGILGKMTNNNPPTNTARTSPDEAPELRTRIYAQDIAIVTEAATVTAFEQKTWFRGWRVVPSDAATSDGASRKIKVVVPVLFFTDDLTVEVDTDEKGQTRVNVKSNSRVGQGDFGENRRHIAQFLRALDKALAAS